MTTDQESPSPQNPLTPRLADRVKSILVLVFGRWQCDPPPWAKYSGLQAVRGWEFLAGDPRRAGILLLVLVAAIAGYVWYESRPTPRYAAYAVEEPELTTYRDSGAINIHPLRIRFGESVAPLKLVGKPLTSGITLSPPLAGAWRWDGDSVLLFTPKGDWPVDGSFSVTLRDRSVLSPRVKLADYTFRFKTRPFSARVSSTQFYQDPADPTLRKVVAAVAFSHPVDTGRFESRVSLLVAPEAGYLGLAPDSRRFTVAYDKLKLTAYVHSSPLAMPRDDTPMKVVIEKGVRAAHGGNESPERLTTEVTIPGRTSLRFSGATMAIVDNARFEPEQILMLRSSSPVAERAFDGKVAALLLPVRHLRQPKEETEPYEWNDTGEIGTDILTGCPSIKLSYVPSDEGGNTTHGFKFRAPVGRYVFLSVKEDIQGAGGYVSAKPFLATVKVSPYPAALNFLAQGALLRLSGQRTVGFLARDTGRVRIQVGRVLPNQLQHLAPQMWDFSNPSVYSSLEYKLVERFVEVRDYSSAPPGKPTYGSIDLGQYLKEQAQGRQGLFLLQIQQAEPRTADSDEEGESDSGYYGYRRSVGDSRLILVTDLGFIVKQTADKGRDVFVQSISSGLPVGGARVEIVGANGLAVQSATTDDGGHARIPRSPDKLRREKQPQLILVQKGADFSFLPYSSQDRDLDVSRFDTGGAENARSAQELSSYLFSDRGIYRPGETAHLGMITRSSSWAPSIGGLPVEVEITDPRGVVVSRSRVSVSASGFDEVTYTSPAAAATGTYEAVAYLAKDAKHLEPLGSTSFRVQEFEPDRMKVQLELSSSRVAGWLRPKDVKARLTAIHLFGEAAGNRRVEGELSLTSSIPRFGRYQDFRFSIGEVLREPFQEQLAPQMSGPDGVAEFKLDLGRFVGRAYRLSVLGRVFEAEGGRSVAALNSATIADADFLVGVKPDGDLSFVRRDSSRKATWLAVNQNLESVAAAGLTLEWVQRKFVSVLTRQRNGTLRYESRPKEILRNSRRVSVLAGGTAFLLPTGEPGDFLLVLRSGTGAMLNSLGYSVVGEANLSRSLERDAVLQIQLDKPEYGAGDTIQVSIRAPYAGAGLISVERERVLCYRWFSARTSSSVQGITLPADFEGNGYVSVQFLRDPSSEEVFMSPLSYGVAPFGAALSARRLPLAVVAPGTARSGTTLSMRVAPGETSRVGLLAVDEGILQVARYRNPDPLGFFFRKRALEVETKQILDLVLPDLKLVVNDAAPGGDAEGGLARHLNPFNRKRKAPVAFWSGLVDVGRDGKDFKYALPDYFNGRVRIVAIAVSPQRIGVAEAATEVRSDFILTPNVPAAVAPGDEFLVSTGVFNNSRGAGPVRLELQAGSGLTILGSASAELQIPEKREAACEFRIRANDVLGASTLRFAARRGASSAHVEESVGVRPASAFRTQLTFGKVEGSNTVVPVAREMHSELRKVEASISALPLVWGQGLTAYLENYEYSCTEQLVSRGFSALVLMTRPEFSATKGANRQPFEVRLSGLRGRMNESGGLGLWSSTPATAEFASVYAAHLLVESRDRAQAVPADMLRGLDDWLTRFASTPASSLSDARMRAYAVYLLVRQGIKVPASLSNVEQELTNRHAKAWPTDLAAAYVASTYRLMQRGADAERIISGVPWSGRATEPGDDVYYGGVVHDAQLLYLLAKHFPARLAGSPPAVLESLSHALGGHAASSLGAAYTLLALDAMASAVGGKVTLAASAVGKDGNEKALPLTSGAIQRSSVPESAAKVKFSRSGGSRAYFTLNESGFDRRPPQTDSSQGIEVIREFVDARGATLSRVPIGTEFFVRLRLRATNRDWHRQMAVVDLLAGGLEPVLELQAQVSSSEPGRDPAAARRTGSAHSLPVGVVDRSDWAPAQVDVREDRVVLYGDVGRRVCTFVYRVRATSAGVFNVPPAFAEGLYNRAVVGYSSAGRLEVVKK